MIDTLMAFWNQNRRKRAAQVLLTFLLMCISISLLFVAMSLPQWSRTQQQGQTAPGGLSGAGTAIDTGGSWSSRATTPTIAVQSTVGLQATATQTVVVPSQETPTSANGSYMCASPGTQDDATATAPSANTQATGTTGNTTQNTPATPITYRGTTPTPKATATRSSSPSPVSSPPTTPTTHVTTTPTPVEPTVTNTPTTAGTPTPGTQGTPGVSSTATATTTPVTPTSTPSQGVHVPGQQRSGGAPGGSASPIATGATQPTGGGWVSACGGNDIGMVAGAGAITFLWHNLWNIIALSFTCTVLFYGVLMRSAMKKRER